MRKFIGMFSLLTWIILVISSFFVPAVPLSAVALTMRVAQVVFGYLFFLVTPCVFIGLLGKNFLSRSLLPNYVAMAAWGMTMMLTISLAFGTIHLIPVIAFPWYANLLMSYIVIGWPIVTLFDMFWKVDQKHHINFFS